MRTFVLFTVVCWSSLVLADWPQWRGPNRDGAAPNSPPLIDVLPAEGLQAAWLSEKLPGGFTGGWGCPIVVDGRVYLFVHHKNQKTAGELPKRKFPYLSEDKRGGMTPAEYEEYEKNRRAEDMEFGKLYEFTESLFCFDAATGKTVWRKDRSSLYSRFVQSGTLTAHDGKLYVLGAARKLRCLDAATGDDVWETTLPGEFTDEFFMSSVAIADGAAIVFCGSLFGVDAATGKLLWEGDPQKTKGNHTSPVVWTNKDWTLVIANIAGGETAGFEPRTGREMWRIKSEANNSTPVVVGDKLITYGSSRRAGMRCYQVGPSGAEELWMYRGAADKGSSPVVVGENVYVQGEKRLACVGLADGDEKWSTTLDLATPQYTSLVAVDGKVIYAFDGFLCFAADPGEFRPLFDAKFDKTGLMATESVHRARLKLAEVEAKENGLEQSLKIFKREVSDQGPLACATPAVDDGRVFMRLRDKLACYDLRTAASAGKTASSPR